MIKGKGYTWEAIGRRIESIKFDPMIDFSIARKIMTGIINTDFINVATPFMPEGTTLVTEIRFTYHRCKGYDADKVKRAIEDNIQ